MRTMTEFSVEYVTFDQNVQKCEFEFDFEIFLMHLTEKIDGFNQLEVLIVRFDNLGRIILEFHVDFLKFVPK